MTITETIWFTAVKSWTCTTIAKTFPLRKHSVHFAKRTVIERLYIKQEVPNRKQFYRRWC